MFSKAMMATVTLQCILILGCNDNWKDSIVSYPGRMVIESIKTFGNEEYRAYFSFVPDDSIQYEVVARCPSTEFYISYRCSSIIGVNDSFHANYLYPCSKKGHAFEVDFSAEIRCDYEVAPGCNCMPN